MCSNRLTLPTAYADEAVQAFGKALRAAMTFEQDYASLVELEGAETAEGFAAAIQRFLRRNHKSPSRPREGQLERLMALAKTTDDVRILRAAIISYGLTLWDKKEDKS